MNGSKRIMISAPPLLMASVDAALTLRGQAPEYWSDGYVLVRESNPIAHWLLQLHPTAFVVGTILWLLLVTAAICQLPIGLARVAAFVVMFGHALGAASWMVRWRFGPVAVLGLFLAARALDGLIWDSRKEPIPRR